MWCALLGQARYHAPWRSSCLSGPSLATCLRPIRIGCAHLDRLFGYPDVGYLSGCWLPIRVCWYPWGLGTLSPGAAFWLVAQWCDTTEGIVHHFGGGVPLPNWCHAPEMVHSQLESAAALPARPPSAPRASLGASARSPARPCGPAAALQASSPISHVILLQLLQTLNLRRWNCSVLSATRIMTVGNYVRLFGKAR